MWTNIFKIGGFHQVSWFQFLPHESELIPPTDKSAKDAATRLVLSSHVQLQKDGFLSTWTNSFVGPWDPSQGVHNPDEKIKLWLFLPGRQSTVADSAQAAVSKLRGAQGVVSVGSSAYLEGFTPVKSLGSKPASYILIPSPSMRFLPPTPLQLPTYLTAISPPLAHLLHSKGSAIPLSTCFVVSKAVPTVRRDWRSKEEGPSSLLVRLIDHYGGNSFSQDKLMRGNTKQAGRSPSSEARELEFETHGNLWRQSFMHSHG